MIGGGQIMTTSLSSGSRLSAPVNEVSDYRRSSLAVKLKTCLIRLGAHPDAVDIARRRISIVSDIVSHTIYRTTGWRFLSTGLIVSEGNSLCSMYIRNRLRSLGIYHRNVRLGRTAGGAVVADVGPTLMAVGAEYESMHPETVQHIGRHIGYRYFATEQRCQEGLTCVARDLLLNGECNWSKIVALYAVAGGMAIDCVRQGKPEFLATIQRAMNVVLEEYLAAWIQANGGWIAFKRKYNPLPQQSAWKVYGFWILLSVLVALLAYIFRYVYNYE